MPKREKPAKRADEADVGEDIARQLRALGVPDEECLRPQEDAVFDVLVEHWRKHHAPPAVQEMAAMVGITRQKTDQYLQTLRNNGRVLHVRKGVWVPVVDPAP